MANSTDGLTSPSPATSIKDDKTLPGPKPEGKGRVFWMIMVAICMALFLSALELTGVSTALPTIVEDIPNFRSSDFIWIGSAYALAGTAFLPLAGSLAQIFGRRIILECSLLLFCIGSAVCGAAHSSTMLVAGRTVQGMGGGGINALTNLILADLVSLQERGKYNAFLSITWSIASVLGPPIAGALADAGQWRWIFYLNLPLSAVVGVLLFFFLRLKTPQEAFSSRMKRLDYGGNTIIIGSTTAVVIALTWGGVVFDWNSAHVLVPLVIGFVGLVVFCIYEATIPREPVTPFYLFTNRTSLSGYLQTFFIQFTLLCFLYYVPVYFQAVKLHSPRQSGADLLGLALSLSPNSIIVGITLAAFRCYRPQLWIGWMLTIIGFGCMSIATADSSTWLIIGLTILMGAGIGAVYTTTMIATLAPIPVQENARAIATGMFLRTFGQVWGIAIGGAILQNRIRNDLPPDILASLPKDLDIAYGSIALVKNLQEPVRHDVQVIFARGLSVLWQAMAGIAGFAFLISLLMKDVPMHRYTDDEWGHEMDDRSKKEKDLEGQSPTE